MAYELLRMEQEPRINTVTQQISGFREFFVPFAALRPSPCGHKADKSPRTKYEEIIGGTLYRGSGCVDCIDLHFKKLEKEHAFEVLVPSVKNFGDFYNQSDTVTQSCIQLALSALLGNNLGGHHNRESKGSKMLDDGKKGTVYLIHFDEKLAHAQHYIGWATDLEKREKEHRSGKGARIINALNKKKKA